VMTTAPTMSQSHAAAAGASAGAWRALRPGSGALAGDLYRRLLAALFVIAWLSLGTQVRLLIGARGLMPLRDFVEAARDQSPPLSFADFPTIFWWTQSDGALLAGIAVGVALALVALAGVRPRLCFALSTALYLSYAVAGRTFLSFQWDNLLLECGLLATFLPAGRAAPLTHFLFRLLLFKLYFESGIAKWQSPLHDWQDGSAMALYYQTAPLPTWLAWHAHHLPLGWHHVESRAVLALELIVPFAIFGPRWLRLTAATLFTVFQLLNIATANYGFFCYLALALHVFLLDDRDLARVAHRARRLGQAIAARAGQQPAPPTSQAAAAPNPRLDKIGGLGDALAAVGALIFIFFSVVQALFHFTDAFTQPGPGLMRLAPVLRVGQAVRVVNTYHLFAAITRERVEPEMQTSADGGQTWTARDLWHKPGDPMRRPDIVAPHQPRVDFQLWFYGLAYQRREPSYVATLVGRLCDDPDAVQALFRAPLPAQPDAVRIAYWRYRFTTPAVARATGAWWTREWIGATRAIPCHR
jgi:hypothetical protein